MQTIVWDVDDVLNELMRNWFEHKWLPEHQSCTVQYDSLTQNPPHEILGVSLEEYLQSLDLFRFSAEGKQLLPISEVMNWFHLHGQRFRHIALTATPVQYAPHSAAWILGHFGSWIRTFAFVPSRRSRDPEFQYDTTKEDYLRWWGKADILVDDNPTNIDAAKQLGIKVITVPRPWNQAEGSLADILTNLGKGRWTHECGLGA